jgi:hypothetical protein
MEACVEDILHPEVIPPLCPGSCGTDGTLSGDHLLHPRYHSRHPPQPGNRSRQIGESRYLAMRLGPRPGKPDGDFPKMTVMPISDGNPSPRQGFHHRPAGDGGAVGIVEVAVGGGEEDRAD